MKKKPLEISDFDIATETVAQNGTLKIVCCSLKSKKSDVKFGINLKMPIQENPPSNEDIFKFFLSYETMFFIDV